MSDEVKISEIELHAFIDGALDASVPVSLRQISMPILCWRSAWLHFAQTKKC